MKTILKIIMVLFVLGLSTIPATASESHINGIKTYEGTCFHKFDLGDKHPVELDTGNGPEGLVPVMASSEQFENMEYGESYTCTYVPGIGSDYWVISRVE